MFLSLVLPLRLLFLFRKSSSSLPSSPTLTLTLLLRYRWIDRIQPWVHYVPIQVDHSDLYDAYIFFRGGLYGEGNHDDLAKKIAYKGREWSRTFWRKEDMTAYFFRCVVFY